MLSIGRTPCGAPHPKLTEILHADFTDFSPIADRLANYDACFLCLGVSSARMKEADDRHITYDYTLAAAKTIVERSDQALSGDLRGIRSAARTSSISRIATSIASRRR